MTMSTTTTVQRDDAAECRAAFEKWENSEDADFLDDDENSPYSLAEKVWQAAWKAAKGV